MAQSKKPLVYLIYGDLTDAVKGIGKKTFLDRPKSVEKELDNFIVVDIPTEIRRSIKGSIDFKANGYGTFSVFVKAKTDGTPNIGSESELVQRVLDVFPINGKHVKATNPSILIQGDDGFGFHVTQITFKLGTKFNARSQK